MQSLLMGAPGKRTVDDASNMVKKLYFTERELMRTLGGYHVSVSNWELKKLIPRHVWQDSLRADALRSRVLEMRYPRRDVDQGHDPDLASFLSSLIRCGSDAELAAGVYFVAKEALLSSYRAYLADADDLDDAPSFAIMTRAVAELEEQLREMRELYRELPDPSPALWQEACASYLKRIGGIFGTETKEQGAGAEAGKVAPEVVASRPAYVPPLTPKRDPRFESAVYHMPPRAPEKFIERQVWQGINHVNEIWAAEIPCLVMWQWTEMPWEFYLDCARWAYDEARHSMMGERRLSAWGFKIGVDYPVMADHYVSVSGTSELHVLALLHAFETNGPGWKAGLKSDFEAVGDTASSQDFDYDWADESIHLQYGHKWVLHRLGGDMDALEDIKENTLQTWHDWIDRKHQQWDYEPFFSRIQAKIAEIEAEQRG